MYLSSHKGQLLYPRIYIYSYNDETIEMDAFLDEIDCYIILVGFRQFPIQYVRTVCIGCSHIHITVYELPILYIP